MSTSLYLITNSKLTGNETKADWEIIASKLSKLNWDTTSYMNANNETIKEYGNWKYDVENEIDYTFNVDFS